VWDTRPPYPLLALMCQDVPGRWCPGVRRGYPLLFVTDTLQTPVVTTWYGSSLQVVVQSPFCRIRSTNSNESIGRERCNAKPISIISGRRVNPFLWTSRQELRVIIFRTAVILLDTTTLLPFEPSALHRTTERSRALVTPRSTQKETSDKTGNHDSARSPNKDTKTTRSLVTEGGALQKEIEASTL
jgi:hypothetical protein